MHAGPVRRAPRDLALREVAPDQRVRRLQRIDVTHRLAPIEQRRVEVRQPCEPYLPASTSRAIAAHDSSTGTPVSSGQWNWNRSMRSTPSRRSDASHSLADPFGAQRPLRRPSGRPIPLQPALGEDERPIRRRQLRSNRPTTSSDVRARTPRAVSIQLTPRSIARRIAAIDSSSSCGPAERPPAAPGRPRAEPDDGNLYAAGAQGAGLGGVVSVIFSDHLSFPLPLPASSPRSSRPAPSAQRLSLRQPRHISTLVVAEPWCRPAPAFRACVAASRSPGSPRGSAGR